MTVAITASDILPYSLSILYTESENSLHLSAVSVLGPAAPLLAEAGEDLVLPCSLQPNISAVDMMVEWTRTDRTDTDNLVHLYEDHTDIYYDQMKSYRGRTTLFKEELQKGNTSLKLSEVQTSDEGVYKCLVKSASWYDDITVHLVEVKGKSNGILNISV
uniref:Ig-like domain-containing protein n=1 Tax=Pygocentrus nattereri TaxID=42514 RepID=A0A3B4DTB0_PYGNA